MKKILCALALVLGSVGAAQAQVHFDSGSARINDTAEVRHEMHREARQEARMERAAYPMRMVRCRDGARRRMARMCRGHGGLARR